MDEAGDPLLHAAPGPLLADEDVHAPVEVESLAAHLAAQRVLLDPVDLEVAERDAVPHADDGERVAGAQGVGQERGVVLAPEGGDARLRQPHLQERRVVQHAQVGVFALRGPDRPQVRHRLRRQRRHPEREVPPHARHEPRVEDLPHARRLAPDRVPDVVRDRVLQRRRRVVGREARGREVRPDGQARHGDYVRLRVYG